MSSNTGSSQDIIVDVPANNLNSTEHDLGVTNYGLDFIDLNSSKDEVDSSKDEVESSKDEEKKESEAGKTTRMTSLEVDDDDDDDDEYRFNLVLGTILRVQTRITQFLSRHSKTLHMIFFILLLTGYHIYFVFLFIFSASDIHNWNWCDDQGFLLLITIVSYLCFFYFSLKKYYGRQIYRCMFAPICNFIARLWKKRYFRIFIYTLLLATIVTFLIVDALSQLQRLRSLVGLVAIVLLGCIFSLYPQHIRWRHVFWGLGLQFLLGLMILRWPTGSSIFQCFGQKMESILVYTDVGSRFVYGDYLVDKKVFYFRALSTALFFGLLINVLFYWGVMQVMVEKVGWLLNVTVGTTACESMNAAANIFLSMTESPLMIKPYLSIMTKSELHAVMTGGMATVTGSILAAFVSFGIPADHLLSASVMSAPAALACAKLFYPETEISRTKFKDISNVKRTEANALEAASKGASMAMNIVLEIAAQIIAILAAIDFINSVIHWLFVQIGIEGMSFQYIVGCMFYPMAWLMGVPVSECLIVGELVGIKSILNEFIAYQKLGEYKRENALSERSVILSTYALCGFSNLGSIGIILGGLSALAPDRKSDLASVAFRSFIAGSAACLLTACVAGTLLNDSDVATP